MSLRPLLEHLREFALDNLFPKRKAMRELRVRWGRPGDKPDWPAGDYFDLVRDRDSTTDVDDKTWIDLEFPKLFASLDASVTPVGGQVLFRRMHEYVGDADALAERYTVYARLQSEVALRETLQHKLLPLQAAHHARIADFVFGELPPPLKHHRLLRAWAPLSLAVLVAAFAWSWLIWVWLVLAFVNAVIAIRVGASGHTLRDVQTLEACLRLVKVADDLAAMHGRATWLPQLAALRDDAVNRAHLPKALRWLWLWRSLSAAFPVSVVVMFLNFTCLAELALHVRAMQWFAKLRHGLAASFGWVGEVDAAIAVASWLTYRPDHCRPTIMEDPLLDIRDGRHPLLETAVVNSIRLDARSLLVTGSNMAGKTTFIKMLAVNAVLGQTLGFCLASRASIPRSRVMASIQAAHSVASGKSHYSSEVETIRSFLARQARGGCAIFAIDELFSGTNTVERVAIARAVLESLGRHSLVLATTHDVELQACLEGLYDLCHFQEDPAVDGFFDYRLRAGPATERNAIRLLAEIGFPQTVIASAMAYAEQALHAETGDDGSIAARLH